MKEQLTPEEVEEKVGKGYRLATDWERANLDPTKLFSWRDSETGLRYSGGRYLLVRVAKRVCAACGKDLYRKKVWEKHGKKVIGYCCGATHAFCRDGSVRRRDEDDPTIKTVEAR
jgi:hypothetical protein